MREESRGKYLTFSSRLGLIRSAAGLSKMVTSALDVRMVGVHGCFICDLILRDSSLFSCFSVRVVSLCVSLSIFRSSCCGLSFQIMLL